ncbi:proton-conducting transporter membrane subunit [Rubrimonas cliftonensis]|uniref:Multisubunit sodium/proton antiporter, MrpD subunit n=1 Tax=Rubrimonas cliftonensis TaxID=89524 RepID=A0A1H4D430_9RHOB|nr:proton-conducting transporter membrane subunit [Rubrimonas cliftonensis]SEA67199.1 multisubunit sodium/proton antiporter, MrpD subunit [Rubrimonas cliftonensis]
MSWSLFLPLMIPFAAAALAVLGPRAGFEARWISVGGSALHLAAAINLAVVVAGEGVVAAQMGGWAAPVGVTLAADALAAIMVLAVAFMGLAVAVYALADIDRRRASAHWHALYQLLLAGASGAFLTGDLFNLYVWFEVMLIASFGLLVIGGDRAQIDGGVKYVALNLVATLCFLVAVGLIHGQTGTLNMADLSVKIAERPSAALDAASVLLFAAFAAKAGFFPLFFWLPAAYHTPPMAVTAIFAAVLTKAGVYAIFRVFTLIFPESPALDALLWIAIATMVTGVIGAGAHTDARRILSFHIVSQIGYMALGLALATPLAIAGAIVYMVHNIVVKANLILIAGVQRRMTGAHDLVKAGGLYAAAPLLAFLFFVSAMAMAGVPPLSGFWGKLALAQASVSAEAWAALAATLGVGLFTLYSMTKIWLLGYLSPHASGRAHAVKALPRGARLALMGPVAALAATSAALGLNPGPLLEAAGTAAAQLLDPTAYVAAVLGAHG